MKKHADKIVVAALLLVFVATLWLCADWLGRIKTLSNRVGTQASVLSEYLRSDQLAQKDGQLVEFGRGSVRTAIQDNWAEGTSPPAYPTSILRSRSRP